MKNKEDKLFRDNLIENITSLINDEEKLKIEYYQRYENCVDIFFKKLEKEIKDEENIIKWPKYKLNENPNDFNNHQIYEIILWYSEISEIFSQLIKKEISINEKINLSSKLLLIDEMKPVSKYLLDVILNHKGNDDNFNISSQNYNVIKSTLNAQFISKIFISLEKKKKLEDIAISFYDTIQNLGKLINDLIKREEIKNEKEIEWAFEKIEKYHFNFNIILPEFEPKDIIFLFINYEKNSENNIIPGPLLINDAGNFQLIEISGYYNNKFSTFTECFDELINFFFLNLFEINGKHEIDHNNLKNKIINKIEEKKNEKPLNPQVKEQKIRIQKNEYEIKLLTKLYIFSNLFEQLDKLKSYKLSYEDVELLNENWLSNENLISNFPSFYFWLCKNYDFFVQIHKELIYQKQDSSISFWIICIRIITSINCITNENFGTQFKQDLISFIKEQIKIKRKKLNSNWINLVMNNVNDKIEIQIFSILYDFIIKISKDK